MPALRIRLLLALALSLGVHAGAARWAAQLPPPQSLVPEPLLVRLAPMQAVKPPPTIPPPPKAERKKRERAPDATSPPAPEKTPAAPTTMTAPPAPTAEEWQLASAYTLKNSKRYRYNWGQQVRSLMGTSVAGERQGLVRVHIEIAPDGNLAKIDVLWSTSEFVEKLALQAIRAMPPLPPTPTGKPLVFEKTIAFLPFETGWPPIYKNDCRPDPPSFKNPFALNGSAPQSAAQAASKDATPTECPDTGPDSIEAEEKDMERQYKEWGSVR